MIYPAQNRPALRKIAAPLLALVLCGCSLFSHAVAQDAPAPSPTEAIPLAVKPVPFDESKGGQRRKVGKLVSLGVLQLASTQAHFGGLSSLQVSPDGAHFLSVSDRGYWTAGELAYDGNGRLASVSNVNLAPLLRFNGQPLEPTESDSESLTFLPDGSALVGFERFHRIWRYPGSPSAGFRSVFGSIPRGVDTPPDLQNAPSNGGLETLVSLGGDKLLAVAEQYSDGNGHMRGWIIDKDKFDPVLLTVAGNFQPTDATRLPNGDVLILQRSFSIAEGPAARIVRIKAADIQPGAVLTGETLATLAPPFAIDNMEGIATRQDAAGHTLIYLISDNNFNLMQRTLLMLFRLEE